MPPRSSTSWASSAGNRASMQSNRGRDTAPELRLRSEAHKLGLRFRVNSRPLPQLRRTADMVFRPAKIAVFMDGCFWHGCPDHFTIARTNPQFWSTKIAHTRERDAETNDALARAGWMTLRFWEHEDPRNAASQVAEVVRLRQPPARGKPPSSA